ncbi:hypothetical protein HDU93_006879, partial [Gonapodya sp. JEL0774]
VVAEAAVFQRGKSTDQQNTIAQLILLGARHMRWWKVHENDFRAMIIAILHALALHHVWVPAGAKDLLAWRTVLCEMVSVMARGMESPQEEIAEVKVIMDGAKARSAQKKEKRIGDKCKMM